MADNAISCPKCGSEELVEWGTNRRMCKQCHEVFVVGEEDIEEKDEALQDASGRAERFLESLREEREKAKEEYEFEAELTLEELEEEEVEISSEPSLEPAPEAKETSDSSEESATQEFEEFYAGLKAEQAREEERYVERPKAAAPKKKTSAKKAIVWIAIAVVIWVVMIIICSLR
jgi:hypothetical protein